MKVAVALTGLNLKSFDNELLQKAKVRWQASNGLQNPAIGQPFLI